MIELLLMAALALAVPDRTVVVQTACTSLEGKKLEDARRELLASARRKAVEQLFGSLVTSLTQVEDLALKKDQIEAASVGYVRLEGDPELFNGPGLGELCVKIQAYTTQEDRIEIDRALRALADTLLSKAPKYVLEADLDRLGLGARTVVAVAATPPQALEGAQCVWSVEPADVLEVPAPDGACRLEVRMPDAPLAGRGSTIPARISVQISREGQQLDELAVRGAVHNALSIELLPSTPLLAPGAAVTMRIMQAGRPDALPPGFTCSWNFPAGPLLFTPLTEDRCQGRLELEPEAEWSENEGRVYAAALKAKLPVTVAVRLFHQGDLVRGGSAETELTYRDTRDPDELIARLHQVAVSDQLARAGLPPLSSFNEKMLELRLAFEYHSWSLTTHYVGDPQPPEAPLDRSDLLKVLYSRDGEVFERWKPDRGTRTLQDLAGVDHVWVKLEPDRGGEPAGPFRLAFNFPAAARAGLQAAWRALNEKARQRIACGGFVAEAQYLAIIAEVSVGREKGSVWRSQRYDARLEHLFDDSFERVATPVGPTDYLSRVTFADGQQEVFACTGSTDSSIRKGGRYYRLARTTNEIPAVPEEIEVYLYRERTLDWTVYFGDLGKALEPAFVRVAIHGGRFHTIEHNRYNRGSIRFPRPEGDFLILRFVAADGEEVEYRGAVDFDQVPQVPSP